MRQAVGEGRAVIEDPLLGAVAIREETTFTEMSRNGLRAAGVHAVTGGDVGSSQRMRDFMRPNFGYSDELRVVFRDGASVWGGAALFRDPGSGPFAQEEIDFVGSLSAVFAAGMRTGLLARMATSGPPPAPGGPAVIIIGAEMNAEIEHASPHGKDAGEKVPGQRRVIGARAARQYREQQEQRERERSTMPAPVVRPQPRPALAFARAGAVIAGAVSALFGRRVRD